MRATLVVLLLASVPACHERAATTMLPPEPVAAAQPPPQVAPHPQTHDCPTEVPGTTVNVDRFDGGIALVFTTLIGDVNDLRGRVHHAAEPAMLKTLIDVPTSATAVDIDGGARLELRPASEADLDRLRASAEHRATQLASGQCTALEPAA